MDYIVSALRLNPELAIFLTVAIGFLIGRVRFGSFSLGIVAVIIGGPRSSPAELIMKRSVTDDPVVPGGTFQHFARCWRSCCQSSMRPGS